MSNYTITTDFGAKDSLPSSNDSKVVRGSEFTTEFTNIQTAIATKADTAGDTFTGVVNFSADVAVNTNTLFVDVSEAKVGIGTTSPQAPLHVHGDINLGNNAGADAADVEIASLNFYNRDTSGSAPNNASIIRAYSHSDTGSGGYLTFATSFGGEAEGADATEKMRIDASGNLLVGTTTQFGTDGISLNQSGWFYVRRTSDKAATFRLDGNDGNIITFDKEGSTVGSIGTSGSRPYFSNNVNDGIKIADDYVAPCNQIGADKDASLDLGSSTVRFKDLHLSGTGYFGTNVGIGTTSPNESLVVKGGTYAANQSGGMALQMGDTSGSHWQSSFKIKSDGSGNVRTAIDASTGAIGGQSQEVISINTTGNVGIGTTSPASPLHVNNTVTASDSLSEGITLSNPAGGTNNRLPAITWDYAATGTPTFAAIDTSRATGTGGNLLFHTASTAGSLTERMRIDSSGQVGIGTTSPAATLSIKGSVNQLDIETSTTGVTLESIDRADHSAQSDLSYYARHGEHKFFNSAYTQAMTIDASGHVIIPEGITLGTTAGTYNASNTLDDYEEGTWTPVIYGSTGGTGSGTIVNAKYTKVGGLVQVMCYINSYDVTGLSGAVRLSGLPFNSNGYHISVIGYCNMFSTDEASVSVSGYTESGSDKIYLTKGSSTTLIPASEATNSSSQLMLNFTYATTS